MSDWLDELELYKESWERWDVGSYNVLRNAVIRNASTLIERARRAEELERELASVKARVLDMRDSYPQEVQEFMNQPDDLSDPKLRQAIEQDWWQEGWQ